LKVSEKKHFWLIWHWEVIIYPEQGYASMFYFHDGQGSEESSNCEWDSSKLPGPSFNAKGSFLQAIQGEGHVGASNFRPSHSRSQHFMINICRITARMER
jgi:hypothetical protein